jgi:hypothetical protein
MTVSFKHVFTSNVSDSADPTLIQPSNWNDEHAVTMASGKLLGRYSANTGAIEEITISTGLSLDGSGNLTATGGGGGISLAEARKVASLRI